MTQEQIVRKMIDGFTADPADSSFQEGFLAALLVVANDVMGMEIAEPLVIDEKTIAKVRPALTVIPGGKEPT